MHTIQRARLSASNSYGIWLIAICSLFAMPGWHSSANADTGGAATAAASDDLWRRTPNGWEVVDRWNRAKASPMLSNYSFRLDSHPAALALVQSLAIVAAFALFPPRQLSR
jgi:hypothetical protein